MKAIKTIIICALYAFIAIVLYTGGITVFDWQYWSLILIVSAIYLINAFDE